MVEGICKKDGLVYRARCTSRKLLDSATDEFAKKNFSFMLELSYREEGYLLPDEFDAMCRKVKKGDPKALIKKTDMVDWMPSDKFVAMVGTHRKNSINHFKKELPRDVICKTVGRITHGDIKYLIGKHGFTCKLNGNDVSVCWYTVMKL